VEWAQGLDLKGMTWTVAYFCAEYPNQHRPLSKLELSGYSWKPLLKFLSSTRIKETQKGFFEVDISGEEAIPNWIQVDTRLQFSFKTEYKELSKTIDEISEKIVNFRKKPIIEVKIQGENIETDHIQAQIARLNSLVLRCFWRISTKQVSDSSVFLDRPNVIDDEMFRLSVEVHTPTLRVKT